MGSKTGERIPLNLAADAANDNVDAPMARSTLTAGVP